MFILSRTVVRVKAIHPTSDFIGRGFLAEFYKLERILATYPTVEGKPGYVWVCRQNLQIIKIDTLREAIKEYLEGDVGDGQFDRDSSTAKKNC